MRGKKVIAGRIVKIFICLTMMMMPLWQMDNARAGAKQRTPIDREQPIQIVSDRLEAYHEKRMVVFTGNAVATQGQRTIRSDRLTLYYKEDKKTAGRSKAETEGPGNLDKVEAKGHVTITEGDRIVTGEEAVFDQEAQKITMTGNAVMQTGGWWTALRTNELRRPSTPEKHGKRNHNRLRSRYGPT
jgi:lipopolysaccharide export system protein LptA